MLLLGIDIGTSYVKASVVDANTRQCIISAQYPEVESKITSLKTGWAEQSPEMWWDHTVKAIQILHSSKKYDPSEIQAIGIAYQMHGLVVVNNKQEVLRDSIIWCDSRATGIGDNAFRDIGEEVCHKVLLNSPGNFTASKLAWVKENEPAIYKDIDKIMLPGDYIAMKLTGQISTTSSALSEGILWDYQNDSIAEEVMSFFGFDQSLIPSIQPLFSKHGELLSPVARLLSLREKVTITYKAGDQINNALSLNVMEPGEVAATAGTSGVIYALTDQLITDKFSRVNAFVHVNHTRSRKRLGVLLCINGAGILNSWVKKLCGEDLSYDSLNKLAGKVSAGSDSLFILPFGNGAERMLQNKIVGAQLHNIDLNKHSKGHIVRAAQEGIAFAFRYGLDILKENGIIPKIIRAGRANLFLSDVFVEAFVNATGIPVELYSNDGSAAAALGAGIGAGIYESLTEAFSGFKPLRKVEPSQSSVYEVLYQDWKKLLDKSLLEH